MTTYHVRESGSDAASGLTYALAKKTFASILLSYTIASGDTFLVSETIRSRLDLASNGVYNSITVAQDPEGSQAWIYPGIEVGTGFTNVSGTLWTKTITTGLSIKGVQFKWLATLDSDSHHKGHLDLGTPATTADTFSYNSGTGLLSINVPSSPNGSAADVVVQRTSDVDGVCGIDINGGTGHVVSGIKGGPFPTSNLGYLVRITNASGCSMINVEAWDPGAHGLGYTLGCVNNTFTNCSVYGGWATSSQFVFNTDTTALMGSTQPGCTVHAYRYLTPTGTPMTTQGTITQVGSYAHSSGTAVVGDINISNYAWREFESGANTPFTGANYASGKRTIGDSCAIFAKAALDFSDNPGLMTRSTLWNDKTPTGSGSTLGAIAMNSGAALTNVFTFEYCAFNLNLDSVDGTTNAVTVGIKINTAGGASCRFDFNNCSFHNRGSQNASNFRAWIDWIGEDRKKYNFRRCVFSHSFTNGVYALCIGDSGTSVANHGFVENVYWQINDSSSRYSQNSLMDTKTKFLAVADTLGIVPTTAPFTGAPGDLSISPVSILWTTACTTTGNSITTAGIGGIDRGFFGAYQPPALCAYLPNTSSGPRLIGLVSCSDGGIGGAATAGVNSLVFADLNGTVGAIVDSYIAAKIDRIVIDRPYGTTATGAGYKIGISGFDGSDIPSEPLNQVNHQTICSLTTYLNQFQATFNTVSRIGRLKSLDFYIGAVAFSSGTSNAVLDSHSTIARGLGASETIDSQAILDWTVITNPQYLYTNREYTVRGRRFGVEAWDLRTQSKIQGQLALASAQVVEYSQSRYAAAIAAPATYFTSPSIISAHRRARVRITQSSGTIAQRRAVMKLVLALNPKVDIEIDLSDVTTAVKASVRAQFNSLTGTANKLLLLG